MNPCQTHRNNNTFLSIRQTQKNTPQNPRLNNIRNMHPSTHITTRSRTNNRVANIKQHLTIRRTHKILTLIRSRSTTRLPSLNRAPINHNSLLPISPHSLKNRRTSSRIQLTKLLRIHQTTPNRLNSSRRI